MVLTPFTAAGNSPCADTCTTPSLQPCQLRQAEFVLQIIILIANENNIKSPEEWKLRKSLWIYFLECPLQHAVWERVISKASVISCWSSLSERHNLQMGIPLTVLGQYLKRCLKWFLKGLEEHLSLNIWQTYRYWLNIGAKLSYVGWSQWSSTNMMIWILKPRADRIFLTLERVFCSKIDFTVH